LPLKQKTFYIFRYENKRTFNSSFDIFSPQVDKKL